MPFRIPHDHDAHSGFTIIEGLAVVVIIGILAAIAAPSWLKFSMNREVEAARDQLHQGIQQAQTQAIATRTAWQFSLRATQGQVEWAIHQHGLPWNDIRNWQPLDPKIVLDEDNTLTLEQNDVHYILFTFKGTVNERSIITLESQGGIADKKCVMVNNLLGTTQDGKELPQPNRFGFECF